MARSRLANPDEMSTAFAASWKESAPDPRAEETCTVDVKDAFGVDERDGVRIEANERRLEAWSEGVDATEGANPGMLEALLSRAGGSA